MKLKPLFFIIPFCSLFFGWDEPVSAKPTKPVTLNLVSIVWPPFSGPKGSPRFAIDLVHEALSRGGVEAETQMIDMQKMLGAIEQGRFDGSPALWRNEEREKFLVYSNPILENRLVLVGLKGSGAATRELNQLKDKKVGLVTGYAYGDAIKKETNPTFVYAASGEENFLKLLEGEIDYFVVDELLIRNLLEKNKGAYRDKVEIGSVPITTRTLHFALRQDFPNAEAMMNNFNENLKDMMTDGSYHKLLKINWIQVDVDGDGIPELVPLNKRAGHKPPEYGYEIIRSGKKMKGKRGVWIDGKLYSDWHDVPDKYKTPMTYERDPNDGFFRLRF